jgi:hypothetical protein
MVRGCSRQIRYVLLPNLFWAFKIATSVHDKVSLINIRLLLYDIYKILIVGFTKLLFRPNSLLASSVRPRLYKSNGT